jgi:spermidine synthase
MIISAAIHGKILKIEYLLLFAVFTIATCGFLRIGCRNFGELFIGDSVKQFSFIIGVYLFSMVGSYFSKFLTNKNLLNTLSKSKS